MASNAQVAIALKIVDQASKQLNAVSSAAKTLEKNVESSGSKMKAFGQRTKKMGASLTQNVTLPILAVGAGMVKVFADFDATLTNIEARTGATAAEMEKIRKVAIDMGRDTAFSATQASEAMLELMTSGSSVEEAISTLPHVLALASAGQLELGRASDVVTDILAQFQLGVESSEEVVNALAAAAQSSSADVESLAQGFANVGPVAKLFGMNVEQTAAALAVFSENGIKGAEAGTQLKSMLTNMSRQTAKTQGAWKALNVSMFNTDGTVKSLNLIISELNNAMSGLTEQERISKIQDLAGSFGQMGLSALLASDGTGAMSGKMREAQTAAQVAKKQMESFNGAINQLSGSMQTFAIVVIGPFVEKVLQPLIVAFTNVLNVFTDLAAKFPMATNLVIAFVAALALLGPVLWLIGTAASIWGTMSTGIALVSAGVAGLNTVLFTLVPTIIGTLIPALSAAATALYAFGAAQFAALGPVGLLVAALVLLGVTIAAFGEKALGTLKTIGLIIRAIIPLVGNILKDAAVTLAKLGTILILSIGKGFLAGAKAVLQAVSDVGNAIVKTIKGVFGIASPSKVMTGIGENLGASIANGITVGVKDNMGAVGNQIKSQVTGMAGQSSGGNLTLFNKLRAAITGPDASKAMLEQIKTVLSGGGTGGAMGGSILDQLFQAMQSGQISGSMLSQLQALTGGGGQSVQAPTQMMAAGGGNNRGGDLNINGNIVVGPGTPKEQARQFAKELGLINAKRGVK